MKRLSLRISIFVLTFIFSLMGIWTFNVGCEIVRTLQKNNYFKKSKWIKDPLNDLKNIIKVDDEIVLLSGCGPNGHSETYQRKNGEFILSNGYWEMSEKEFRNFLKDKEILKTFKNAKNRNGEKGMKLFAKSVNNTEIFYIFWYRKGYMYSISAPTLDVALDFENRGMSAVY